MEYLNSFQIQIFFLIRKNITLIGDGNAGYFVHGRPATGYKKEYNSDRRRKPTATSSSIKDLLFLNKKEYNSDRRRKLS